MSNREVVVPELPRCDICGNEAHYDARTNIGCWMYLCEDCHKVLGVGLGMGRGQKLILAEPAVEVAG